MCVRLRFPAILEIDTKAPADFQGAIRRTFPVTSENTEIRLEPSQGPGGPVRPDFTVQAIQPSVGKNWQFSSPDSKWSVNLTRSFVALSTQDYSTWEDFRDRLKDPFEALLATYEPSFFSRIGLRYIDVFKLSHLGLTDIAWNELVGSAFTGLLGTEMAAHIKEFQCVQEVNLSETGSVARIATRLLEPEDDDERRFEIDGDYYDGEQTGVEAVWDRLSFLHERASRLLSWATTDRLRKAMEPVSMENGAD